MFRRYFNLCPPQNTRKTTPLELVEQKKVFSFAQYFYYLEKKLCEQSIVWSKSQYNSDLVRFSINGGCSGSILLPQQYPFQQPYLRFELAPNLFTHKNLEQYQPYDYYFPKRLWTPKLTVDQIISKQLIRFIIFLKFIAVHDYASCSTIRLSNRPHH